MLYEMYMYMYIYLKCLRTEGASKGPIPCILSFSFHVWILNPWFIIVLFYSMSGSGILHSFSVGSMSGFGTLHLFGSMSGSGTLHSFGLYESF